MKIYKRTNNMGVFGLLFLISFVITMMASWIVNVVKIFGCSFDPLTAIPILRIVGIFVAPLGSVLGFVPN